MKLLNSIYICIFTGTSWWSDDGARRRDSFSLLYILLICVCFIGVGSGCIVGVGLMLAYIMSYLTSRFFVVFFLIFFFLSYLYSFMPFLIWPSFQIMRGGGTLTVCWQMQGYCLEEEDKGVYIFTFQL